MMQFAVKRFSHTTVVLRFHQHLNFATKILFYRLKQAIRCYKFNESTVNMLQEEEHANRS